MSCFDQDNGVAYLKNPLSMPSSAAEQIAERVMRFGNSEDLLLFALLFWSSPWSLTFEEIWNLRVKDVQTPTGRIKSRIILPNKKESNEEIVFDERYRDWILNVLAEYPLEKNDFLIWNSRNDSPLDLTGFDESDEILAWKIGPEPLSKRLSRIGQ